MFTRHLKVIRYFIYKQILKKTEIYFNFILKCTKIILGEKVLKVTYENNEIKVFLFIYISFMFRIYIELIFLSTQVG